MNVSEAGIAFISGFEGLRLTAYQDQGGVWTIGYGHTGPDVHQGLRWTQEQALNALRRDADTASVSVKALIRAPINQKQFDALTDFVFNLGPRALMHSNLRNKLNDRNYSGAAEEFLQWDHVNGREVEGLKRRRQAESDLFMSS